MFALLLVQLVIPKHHGAKLEDIPDEHLGEILVSRPLHWSSFDGSFPEHLGIRPRLGTALCLIPPVYGKCLDS